MTLSVIGAGMPRTGTSSLKMALDMLGFGPCYHMTEVITHPERADDWSAAADGKPVDWDKVFQGYSSTVDAPGNGFYLALAAKYPQAKVILSVRDPESWFTSTQESILQPPIMQMHTKLGTLDMCNKIGWGDRPELRDKNYMLSRFQKHNEEVKKTIPAARLLVFEAKQGWEPLCKFLGVAVPSQPYPKVNSRSEMGDAAASMMEAFSKMTKAEAVVALRQMLVARTQTHGGA
jgi:hypothetical protein